MKQLFIFFIIGIMKYGHFLQTQANIHETLAWIHTICIHAKPLVSMIELKLCQLDDYDLFGSAKQKHN